jgi:anaerobic magnesium-protoporphyrin IX monomethyl ester cyclase
MKITFIEPPSLTKMVPERLAGCTYELYHFPDLGNLFALSLLHEHGFEVGYVDSVLERLHEDTFLKRIKEERADYYVIHSVILSKKTDIYYISRIIEAQPEAVIVIHGPEPTRVPEQYLFNPSVLIFRGEIEENFLNFLKGSTLRGVSRIENGSVKHYPPADSPIDCSMLPHVMRDHPVLKKYSDSYYNPKFSRRPHTVMMASRGCSFRCLFCVPNSVSFAREMEFWNYTGKKPKASVAEADWVIEEFRKVKEQGYNSVMAVDDQFLWGKERTLKICKGIKDLDLEWGCLSRADFLQEEEVVSALAEAGCISIDIGVENFNQKILDYIQKDLSEDAIIRAIENTAKYKISPKINIMIGTCPLEKPLDILYTIKRLKQLPIENVMFSIATPFKGTQFYKFCQQEGYLIDESDEINPFGKAMISLPYLSNRDLERYEKYAYRSFYIRPSIIWKRLKSYKNVSNFLNDIKITLKLLKR